MVGEQPRSILRWNDVSSADGPYMTGTGIAVQSQVYAQLTVMRAHQCIFAVLDILVEYFQQRCWSRKCWQVAARGANVALSVRIRPGTLRVCTAS